ncbi:MAG: hypothetical protein PHG53_09705 [Phycisphaerae bacterium]|nr:hypothetical protein [Phycisphaerae bacterium]
MKNDKKETAEEFAERMKIKWHNATIQIKPDNAPVSTSLPNKLMKDLHEALAFIDRLSAENKEIRGEYQQFRTAHLEDKDNMTLENKDLRASRERWKKAVKYIFQDMSLDAEYGTAETDKVKYIIGDEFEEIKE